ncbi:SH3 domain-containing protein [Priestia megaterium]|uniref:SH3 domain-containing protein n=1 Tax=Priestia megaterium TaxID=1404 RepID=UPI000A93BCFF|nr:SH3 domain-containing protein [Priestia megaterium]
MKKLMVGIALTATLATAVTPGFGSIGGNQEKAYAATVTYKVTASKLNVRSGAGTTYGIIGSVVKDQTLSVVSKSGSWYKINYNGRTGYVSSDYVQASGTTTAPTTPPAESAAYTVTASTLNVRSGAGTNYASIGSVIKGQKLSVVSKSGSWYKINYNGRTGYVSSDYVQASGTTTAPTTPPAESTAYTVTASTLNVRSGAGTNYASIGSVTKGQKLSVVSKSGSWYKINYNGRTGYVSSDYVQASGTTTAPTTPPAESTAYTVTASTLNVRSGAGTNYASIGSVTKGQKLSVVSKSGSWYKINYNGRTGYVSSDYVQASGTTTAPTTPPAESTAYTVTASTLNVRSGAGTSYASIGSVTKGQKLSVVSKSGSWYKINYNGRTGYVSSDYVQASATASPKLVVDSFKTLGNAQQVILVTADNYDTKSAKIQTFEKVDGKWKQVLTANGVLGQKGFALSKKEGDMESPTGKYTIGTAFGRYANPGTKLPYRKITANDVWVDDSKSSLYNTWQQKPANGRWTSAENMDIPAYDYGFVINYNESRTPGKGSAIFFHVGTNYTAGCTATSKEQVVSILKWLNPEKNPVIIQSLVSELDKY